MEFLKNIVRSITWHIGKIITYAIIILLLTFALRSCEVNALTISNSSNIISDSNLTYLQTIYDSSDYKYYIITSDNDSNTYSRQRYYLCLKNDTFDYSTMNLSTNCDEQYIYAYNDGYKLTKSSDLVLNLSNSIYYSNIKDVTHSITLYSIIFLVCIVSSVSLWFMIISRIIHWRREGLSYEID